MSAVDQLDTNMDQLRQWLARMEAELSQPVVYQRPEFSEIQRWLQQTQQLQGEVERHTTGVSSGRCYPVTSHHRRQLR